MARLFFRRSIALTLSGWLPLAPLAARGEGASGTVPDAVQREVAGHLIRLLDDRRLAALTVEDYQNTALLDVLKFNTPAGYRMKYRVLQPGVAVAQALALTHDTQLRIRLVEAARWGGSAPTRATALLGLAALRIPDHLKYFREALLDTRVAVQFAAVEGLQEWGDAQTAAMLVSAAKSSWSPLIRVYAAQAALRLGRKEGHDILLAHLIGRDWFLRALAARYLGDLGDAADGETLLTRLGPERDNRFVLAELCIAALKLGRFKSSEPPSPAPPPAPPAERPAPERKSAYELEPLVVTAPRLRTSGANLVDPRIDVNLVELLEKMATDPTPEQQLLDPALTEVNQLVTPQGFGLKVRYSDIGYLLTEGLAGTGNYTLIQRLETIARTNANAGVRASALVALGYDRTRTDLFIFEEALRDPSLITRFGAAEGLAALAGTSLTGPARSLLAGVAQSDTSPALRVFAAWGQWRAGDVYGREELLRGLGDSDWVIRALSAYFLGDLGNADDAGRMSFQVRKESARLAEAEAALALLRLSRNP
jgi:HEAT repeat protein